LIGSIYGRFSIRIAHFFPIINKHGRHRHLLFKNCLWQPYLLMDLDELSSLYREPPIDVSYQISVHLAKQFQRRRFFRNHPIRNKNCLWWPYLLTDRCYQTIKEQCIYIILFQTMNDEPRLPSNMAVASSQT
jgi:hypothetical protein